MNNQRGKHEKKFPVWLICLIIFALIGVGVFFAIRKMAKSGNVPVLTNVPVESIESPAVTEAPAPTAEIIVEPEPAPTEEPAEETPALPEESAEPTPEPTPEPLTFDGQHVHTYADGVCTGCGQKPMFCKDFLPEQYYIEANHRGKLEKHAYTVKNYMGHGNETLDKTLLVYVPYGYDETKPYNVLVLMPSMSGDENEWLNRDYTYGDKVMNGKKILDNMFERGDCEPFLVVCPQLETLFCQGFLSGKLQMIDEIREYILPWVVENYSTWAKDGTPESLKEARNHFALGGPSDGALFTFEGGMRENFDLFASYMALSGNGQPWNTVAIIQQGDYRGLPIQCLFTGSGTYGDIQQNYTQIGYDYFVQNEPRLKEGVNAFHVEVEGEHEWKVWLTELYNAAPLLFQECSVV